MPETARPSLLDWIVGYYCACGCGRTLPKRSSWDGMHGPDYARPIRKNDQRVRALLAGAEERRKQPAVDDDLDVLRSRLESEVDRG